MTKITKAHACAAIAWAKANPDKIVNGVLALSGSGRKVDTLDPQATCFCILGRIAKEAGISAFYTNKVTSHLQADLKLSMDETTRLWKANDRGLERGKPLQGAEYLESLL